MQLPILQRSRIFDQNKTEILKEFFVKNEHPSRKQKAVLAKRADLNMNQVRNWFYRKQLKQKKSTKSGEKN